MICEKRSQFNSFIINSSCAILDCINKKDLNLTDKLNQLKNSEYLFFGVFIFLL
jgi:hypothetical protein